MSEPQPIDAAATFTGLREQTIRNGLGHLQVGGPGFTEVEARPLVSGIADVDALCQAITADRRVKAAAARIDFTGLASNGERSVAVLGRGIQPEHEYTRANFRPRMVTGRPVAAGAAHEATRRRRPQSTSSRSR